MGLDYGELEERLGRIEGDCMRLRIEISGIEGARDSIRWEISCLRRDIDRLEKALRKRGL